MGRFTIPDPRLAHHARALPAPSITAPANSSSQPPPAQSLPPSPLPTMRRASWSTHTKSMGPCAPLANVG